MLVSIEGNIGAGKSTLKSHMKDWLPDAVFIDEPVDIWTSLRDEEDKSLLEHFYDDKHRWAYTFQNFALISRLNLLETTRRRHPDCELFITERSVLTDKHVFAELVHESGYMNAIEWKIYNSYFDRFASSIKVDGIIYVTTSVEVSQDRIISRSRKGEASIDSLYLHSLHDRHMRWLTSTSIPLYSLDTGAKPDLEEQRAPIVRWLRSLHG